jgi:hypothetical protein
MQLPPIDLCLSHHQSQNLMLPCFWQFAMNSSWEHAFVLEGFWGCAAETPVVPISDNTTRVAKVRGKINPSEMVPEIF